MIDAKSLSTLGVGFGNLAISTLGILVDAIAPPIQPTGTGAYFVPIEPRKKRKPIEDEEILLMMLL